MKIKLLHCDPVLFFFKENLEKKFGLTTYDPFNPNHLKAPCVFFGIYSTNTIHKIGLHDGIKIIIPGGTDAPRLKNRFKETFLKMWNKHDNIYICAISGDIVADIKQIPCEPHPIRFYLADESHFHPIKMGPCIYVYTSHRKGGGHIYGQDIINELISRLPQFQFLVCDCNTYVDVLDAYKQCFIGLRLTKHDGNANTVQELGLCGIRCVHNGEMPNAVGWKTIEDIEHAILQESNLIGQINYDLVQTVNKYLKIGKAPDWLDTDTFLSL